MAKKRGYKFTNKAHSGKAVMSTVFGLLSMVSLIVIIYLSYLKGGQAPVNYALAGILSLIFAITGAILSVLALQEKDRFKLFGWIGAFLNFLVIAGISGILYAGSAM